MYAFDSYAYHLSKDQKTKSRLHTWMTIQVIKLKIQPSFVLVDTESVGILSARRILEYHVSIKVSDRCINVQFA